MPGIYGIVSEDRDKLEGNLRKMGEALHVADVRVRDRWFDGEAGVGLGRESLGIFLPEPQPVIDQNHDLVVMMEGELYDTDRLRKELSESGYPAEEAIDPELVQYLYQCKGAASFARLHGAFIIALWDFREHQLVLANDRFGLRALYYYHGTDCFAFAREIKGLLELGDLNREIDDAGVADFFTFGYLLGDKTLFHEIRILPPATLLIYKEGNLNRQSYWNLAYQSKPDIGTEEDCAEKLIELLTQAVQRRLNGGLSIGLPLSGGLDSRTLLAITTKRLGVCLPTYTYGLPDSQDMRRAKQLASVANVPHNPLILEQDYIPRYAEENIERVEGLLNCVISHGFKLNAMADSCQVMMLGNPGGALFNTRRTLRGLRDVEGDPTIPCYNVLACVLDEDQKLQLFNEDFYDRIRDRDFESFRRTLTCIDCDSWDDMLDTHRMRESVRRTSAHGRFTIGHHMEFNEPYFDYDIVDFALGFPVDFRWNRKVHKLALSRLSPDIAEVEGGPKRESSMVKKQALRIYRRIKWQLLQLGLIEPSPKQTSTFTNYNNLLRNENYSWVEAILLSSTTLDRGYYRPDALRVFIDDHMQNRCDYGLKLGALITFELWHRRFLD